MKIRIKQRESEIEIEFTSSVTKDKYDVMRIVTHIINEFQSIANNENSNANDVRRVDETRVHDTA
jgi:hypothetical protein